MKGKQSNPYSKSEYEKQLNYYFETCQTAFDQYILMSIIIIIDFNIS